MSSETENGPRFSPRIVLLVSMLLAAVVRLEYLRELIASPFGEHLLLDALWYDQAARGILDGVPLADGAAYFRPPLYPMFVAALYALFDSNVWAVRAVQWVLGVGHVALCWSVARRTHGERVAALTAVLAATYGMFVYFEGELLTTALGVVTTTGAAALLLEADHRSAPLLYLAGGLVLGAAATLHGTALVLAPAAVLWALSTRGRWIAAIAITIGVLVPVGAVTARNYLATGEPVVIASQGGINFYIGNNEHADGKSALAPGFAEAGQVIRGDDYRDSVEIAAETLAERELQRELSPGEVSRYWFAKSGEWMRDQPKAALALFGRKLLFFWNGYEISNNRDLRDQANRFTPILRPFLSQWALLLPFGILGVVRSGRHRPRALLVTFLIAYTLAIAAFFVCSRYRQPAVAWLLPFAAAGLLHAWNVARTFRTNRRRAATVAVGLVAMFLLTNGMFLSRIGVADVMAATDAPFHRYNLAVLFEREGDLDRAIEEYRAAAATGVRDPRIHLNLANTLARTGRLDEARDAYRETLRIAPDFGPAVRCNLGIVAAQERDWPEAIRQFEECVALDPTHLNGLLGLGAAYLSSGRFDEAIVTLRQALARPGAPQSSIRRNLAAAYLEAGLLEEAEREATAALRLDDADIASMLTLGKVHVRLGRPEEAQRMWDRARALAPGSPAVEQAIEEARQAGS